MEDKPEFGSFIQFAKKLGARDAKLIDPATVVTASWVRLKCQYGCHNYNSRLCCPPFAPTPEQTRLVLDGYKTGLLVHFDGDEIENIDIAMLERHIFLAGYYKAFAMEAYTCKRCKKCHVEKCAHPEDSRPTMEACGIDVYATVRSNGFPLKVIVDEKSTTPDRYALVLIE